MSTEPPAAGGNDRTSESTSGPPPPGEQPPGPASPPTSGVLPDGTWTDTAEVQTGPVVDVVLPDGTWTDNLDNNAEGQTGPVLADPVARREQQRHLNNLQLILLKGVGALVVFMVVVLVLALAFGGISEDFATTLAQMTIPTLLTFGGAIVGTLFGKGSGGDAS